MKVAPLAITPSDPLTHFLLPFPATLCFAGLTSKGKNASARTQNDSKLLPSHLGLLMPLNQQAKKGVTVLTAD